MRFLCVVGVIVDMILTLPYIRCFLKRIAMAVKLYRLCKRRGFRLYGAHLFWIFSSKHSLHCDFYVETRDEVFSVKLFGTLRRGHTLIFTKTGEWFVRKRMILFANTGGALELPTDTKRRPFPQYNFRYRYRTKWEIKTPHRVLLVHPVCHEICLDSKIVGAGDVINDCECYSLSRLMGKLEVTEQ